MTEHAHGEFVYGGCYHCALERRDKELRSAAATCRRNGYRVVKLEPHPTTESPFPWDVTEELS